MQMDETLYGVAEKLSNFAVIYVVDISEVPEFTKMYELYDPCTVMFFFRNRHIMIDLGTGDNNKINWPLTRSGVSLTRSNGNLIPFTMESELMSNLVRTLL